MGKSVYSLVLNNDVIDEIDKAAYTIGTSRSNLINQILADYVSYTTPEKQMQSIFDTIDQIMGAQDIFKIQSHASNSMLSVFSALKYKYHPTIRYSLELSETEGNIGTLRVLFRTQNETLILALSNFFEIFSQLEMKHLSENFSGGVEWGFDSGKFNRTLKYAIDKPSISAEELGNAIAYYIDNLDTTIKEYFANLNNSTLAFSAISKRVKQYKKNAPIKL